ncbi:MAG: c-type cytochrome [Acidobacteriota bacterium]|nr:c-type cytochrome [Acidobacteriota bacterium]
MMGSFIRGFVALIWVPLVFAQAVPGQSEFTQQCGFCHGRDAGGGEDGPDLTRSRLVAEDVKGNKIGPVVRNGRPGTSMPPFTVSDQELAVLVNYIHQQKTLAESQNGQRKGVDASDLQTGSAEAGRQYFNGTGKCATCHSPTGDLAGFADRFEGRKLMQRFLYPKGAAAKMTVTLPSGQTVTGTREFEDEFYVGLRDASGFYHSWPTSKVKVKVDDPSEAHVDLLAKYTDDDMHNLMAYLQTLKKNGAKK